ncbi:protein lin-54 homolog isoform X2 [Bacillus rossius redtenbacheri]|uniref:protein lin-54 homolog isoform X2 n=1 Tax=Bacillus rossius redtenbacheri TaxID=93214 RepID=UPI002FDD74BC
MPSSDTGGAKSLPGVRAIAETLELEGATLGDGDLTAFALQTTDDRFTSSELETLANIEAELECLSTEVEVDSLGCRGDELVVESEEQVVLTSAVDGHGQEVMPKEEVVESILPDLEDSAQEEEALDIKDMGVPASPSDIMTMLQGQSPLQHQMLVTSSSNNFTHADLISKPSQVPGSSIVVIQSPAATSSGELIVSASPNMTVSGGQLLGGKLSVLPNNLAVGSAAHFHTLGQTLVSAKAADGSIVHFPRTAVTRTTGSTTVNASLPGIKPIQTTVKRPASNTSGVLRNVYTKVMIAGSQSGQQGQPIMIATAQAAPDGFPSGHPLKIITSTGQNAILGSPPKAITLAQAQQMGLLSPSKSQQILPSTPSKQSIVVNKMAQSPAKPSAKITLVAAGGAGAKPPAKILPAPASGVAQLRPGTVASLSVATATTPTPTTVRPLMSPQKVIIRQGALKPGTVLTTTSGQMIRIPATQNAVGSAGTLAQFSGGKQLQFVRMVSATSAPGAVKATASSAVATSAAGQVASAALRSQPQAVKVVPIAPATTTAVRTVGPKTATSQPTQQRILIPASASMPALRPTTPTMTGQLGSSAAILQSGANSFVVLPTQYLQQVQQKQHVPIAPSQSVLTTQKTLQPLKYEALPDLSQGQSRSGSSSSSRSSQEPNGIRPRKPCNCTKSQCLKLYCDCFANGEFCNMCNCNNCYNNLEHEEERQRAIKSCLERNPHAFRPKIGKGVVGDERRHNKGCNCKRSGCLKNYCECYEAKIPCSKNCRCVSCRNVEDLIERRTTKHVAEVVDFRAQQAPSKSRSVTTSEDSPNRTQQALQASAKLPYNFLSQEVLDATCQCLLAQGEKAERSKTTEQERELMIIEEFGKCLVQIIEFARQTEDSSSVVQ